MLDQDETRQRRRWRRARATLVATCVAVLLNGLWLWFVIPPELWRPMIVTVALFAAAALAVAALEVRGLL